jgi:dolichol-phosphate mannosyltransferase
VALNLGSLDIVTSALNEEVCLPEFLDRITKVLDGIPELQWRVIICDNGSTDSTWNIISLHAEKDPRVIGFRLSKNFNLDASLTCGLDHARADAVVIMASDLQDPPEVIPQLIAQQALGFEQVLVKIIKRESLPFIYNQLSQAFYSVANRMTSGMLPRNVSDFRLLTRVAYESARKLREQNRFLRGLIAWTGFNSSYIEIERPRRFGGDSKFLEIKLSRVIHWAVKAILAHTSAPLLWISLIGIFSGLLSATATIVLSVLWFAFGVPFAGFGTIVGVATLGFSLVLFSLGIMSQYLALIYDEVKQRPLYLVQEHTNVLDL